MWREEGRREGRDEMLASVFGVLTSPERLSGTRQSFAFDVANAMSTLRGGAGGAMGVRQAEAGPSRGRKRGHEEEDDSELGDRSGAEQEDEEDEEDDMPYVGKGKGRATRRRT